MNKAVVTIILLFLVMWSCVYLSKPKATTVTRDTTNVNVVADAAAADGLDLKAVGALVKTVSSAEELERELNKSGGINNLDLDSDGKVDFINVTEYGNKNDEFGFSLTTEPVKGEVQEIANIEIIKESEEQAVVQVHGNQHVYGHGHHYSATHSITNLLLLGYLLRPHPFYTPYYGFGYYPSYYRGYPSVTRTVYTNRVNNATQGSRYSRVSSNNVRQTGINNPNKGKVANKGITKSLANPTSTQKQFRARSASKSVRSGGFGKSSSSSSVRNRSSGRGFGGRGK